MKFPLTTLALAPVLLLQGRRVRRALPHLPEPPGARAGRYGRGPRLRLLILGDSAAAGVGAPDQASALSGQLVQRLGAHYRVDWRLIARTGDTARQVIDHLQAQPRRRFDVAVLSVGVNDVTARTGDRAWRRHQQQLIDLLSDDFGVRQILLTALPPMHQFPSLPQPLRWYLGWRARQLTELAQQFAARHPACELLRIDLPMQADHLAADGFHPAPPAYAVWAAAACEAIRRHDAHQRAARTAQVGAGGTAISA